MCGGKRGAGAVSKPASQDKGERRISTEVNPSRPRVLVNPFPSHVLTTVLGHCDSREGLGRCKYNVSPGSIFAVDLYKGG